jgi:hypothetical protein
MSGKGQGIQNSSMVERHFSLQPIHGEDLQISLNAPKSNNHPLSPPSLFA